jgi:hypothetical protein
MNDSEDTQVQNFEFTDECALTLHPSSKPGYETLSIYEGETALKIRLTPEARLALAMTVEAEPDRVAECTEGCAFRDREHTHFSEALEGVGNSVLRFMAKRLSNEPECEVEVDALRWAVRRIEQQASALKAVAELCDEGASECSVFREYSAVVSVKLLRTAIRKAKGAKP